MISVEQKKIFSDIELYKNDIYVLRHEISRQVPQHTHSQGHILVVLSGVAKMNVEHSEYYIPNGYFVWIPPMKSHRISFEDKKISLLNIYYPVNFSDNGFYSEVGVYPMPSILYHVIELIEDETTAYKKNEWKYELLSTVNHILPHIIRKHEYELRLPTTDNPIVEKILSAIHRRYNTALTVDSIAKEVGMSSRSLSRYLRSELNVSFIQYVRSYRIITAIKMMVKSEDSISNIAYSVGFDSLTTFSNSFLKVTGVRPSFFLKQ